MLKTTLEVELTVPARRTTYRNMLQKEYKVFLTQKEADALEEAWSIVKSKLGCEISINGVRHRVVEYVYSMSNQSWILVRNLEM